VNNFAVEHGGFGFDASRNGRAQIWRRLEGIPIARREAHGSAADVPGVFAGQSLDFCAGL